MQDADHIILRSFLQAGDTFVSGSRLAERLGISRVGIWARLEKLKAEGFAFEAVRNRGYRMIQEPPILHGKLLEAALTECYGAVNMRFLDAVDSTNSEAERLLALGESAPLVVVAAQQTKGRGRMGRQWHSPRSGNLYASFAWRPGLPYPRMQNITVWLGICVCQYLRERCCIPAWLKWPNDILIEGRKVAGMLTEARIDTDQTRELVYGLGMNIMGDTTTWPEEVAKVATTLASYSPNPIALNSVAAGILATVLNAYTVFRHSDVTGEMLKQWQECDALFGQTIQTELNGQTVTGQAAGLHPSGGLRLKLASGETRILHSGEVHIGTRPQQT